MNEDKMIFQDSYTEKVGQQGKHTLKVYLNFLDLPECELKLKNFYKVKKFINELRKF